MLFSSLLKAKNKIHFTNSYRKLLGSGITSDQNLPESLRILSQLSVIDEQTKRDLANWVQNNPDTFSSNVHVPDSLKTNLAPNKNKKFDIPENYIVLAPGSVWETKKWPPQKFGQLASLIKMHLNTPVVVLGGPQEKDLSRQLKQFAPSVIDLTGETSLIDCKHIIAHSLGFIGNDSGLVHMAALYNIPSVVVLGPTHESLGFRPWQNNVQVATLNLECSPCGTHGADACPIGTHACMNNLEAELVLSHLRKVLPQKQKTSEKITHLGL